MGVIAIILLVAFVIVCIFSVLLIMVQNDESGGMGGLLGGRGTAAFGSHSASVLTKTTLVLVVLFFAFSISLAVVHKKPRVAADLMPQVTAPAVNAETNDSPSTEWWNTENSAETSAVEQNTVEASGAESAQ